MLDSNKKLINPEIRIEPTNFCNSNCVMCAQDQMKRPRGYMIWWHFKNIVYQAKDLGVKCVSPFGFGESLLHKQLPGMVKYCNEIGLETFLTTNGSLCDWGNMYNLFTAGLNHIRFSVHGFEKNYESVQRGLDFNATMTNIYSAIKLRDVSFPDRKISITIIPQFGESLEELRKWELTGIDWLEVWKPHNWNQKMDYRKKRKERKKTCGRPFSGPVQVQWDGRVIPCCFLTDAEIVLGDLNNNTLLEVLEGDKYELLRQKHRKGDLRGLPCENCDQLNIGDEPLIYSSRDESRSLDTTSSTKFKIGEQI